MTRLEKATSKVAGTYWDKIQKSNGTVGYVARETYENEGKYKLYLVPINESNSSDDTNSSDKNTDNSENNQNNSNNSTSDSSTSKVPTNTSKVKIGNDNKIITVTPDAIAKDILDAFGGPTKITRADKNFLNGESESLATGYIVEDKYTVVKKGDCNGDGKVNTADLLAVQKQLLSIENLIGYSRTAGDTNNDDKINTADLLAVQKYLLNISDIQI